MTGPDTSVEDPDVAPSPSDEPAGGAVLVVPEGRHIDELAVERLRRQLRRAPESVAGVAALDSRPPPGASYRVHAERMAMLPWEATDLVRNTVVDGVVLLRVGVDHLVSADGVEVNDAPLLIDHGCPSHDPARPSGPLAPASRLGRPPFPWRPVVALLQLDEDDELTAWANRLADDLVGLDIEPRLLVPRLVAGAHLTCPAEAGQRSVSNLEPEVIVALDRPAAEVAPAWCGSRATTVIVRDPTRTRSLELVSFRLGEAPGRLRAYVGAEVEAEELATSIRRFASGPPAAPPSEGRTPTAAPATTQVRIGLPARRRSIEVLSGTLDGWDAGRLTALAGHLSRAGHSIRTSSPDAPDADAVVSADLLIMAGVSDDDSTTALVGRRRAEHRPTLLMLGGSDLEPGTGGEARWRLWPASLRVARLVGSCIVEAPAVHVRLQESGITPHLLAPLLPPAQLDAIVSVTERDHPAPKGPVIGWQVGTPGDPAPVEVDPVAVALSRVLDHRSDLCIELAGDIDAVPSDLLARPGVVTVPGSAGLTDLRRWHAQLWTPSPGHVDRTGDILALLMAARLGVPTITSQTDPLTAQVGHPGLRVGAPGAADAWQAKTTALLEDSQVRAWFGRQEQRRADAVAGPDATREAIEALLSWADREVGR